MSQSIKEEEAISNPHELYLVCKSNLIIRQGKDPENPCNIILDDLVQTSPTKKQKSGAPDFYIGDIFQGKVSKKYDGFIQLRAASKANKMQWIDIKEKHQNEGILNIFPPSINEYFHLDIGATAALKCKYLSNVLSKCVDEIYRLYLSKISSVIVTYLPFYYPVFSINGTFFRGRSKFTQFCVPYFHSKGHCKEYLKRIEQYKLDRIGALNNDFLDEDFEKKLDFEYEKKLMLEYQNRMNFESVLLTQNEDEKDSEEAAEYMEEQQSLDAAALNEIVSVKKGCLPEWIRSIYDSIPSAMSYFYCIELYFMSNDCMIHFQKDEYLEQNKYSQFVIRNGLLKTGDDESAKFERIWAEPKLIAKRTGINLSKLIDVNTVGGSRWFDVVFDPADAVNEDECQIFHETVKSFWCKVGGKWQGDSKSRHYIEVKDENGNIFSDYLPMIRINLVL